MILIVSALMLASCSVSKDEKLLRAYEQYYNDVETLLDSIAAHNESFMDTEGETDAYYYYILSRKQIEKLK